MVFSFAFEDGGRRLITNNNVYQGDLFGANAAIQLGSQLNNNTDVVDVFANFDNASLTVDAMRGITQFVQENPSLRKLVLNGHGTNAPVIEAVLAAASGNRNIREFGLGRLPVSAAYLQFLRSSFQLEQLYVTMVDTVITIPPNALQVVIASMPSLEYLELIDQPNTVYTVPIINACRSLRKLELFELANDPARSDAIGTLLRNSPALETFILQSYELVDLRSIFSALPQSSVRNLELRESTDEIPQVRTSAAEALRGNTTIWTWSWHTNVRIRSVYFALVSLSIPLWHIYMWR